MENEDTKENQKMKEKLKNLNNEFTKEEKQIYIQKEKQKLIKKYKMARKIAQPKRKNKRKAQLLDTFKTNIQKIKDSKKHPGREAQIKKLNKRVDKTVNVRKIRIYPNKDQKETFKKWIGTCRYLYNQVLHNVKKGEKVNFIKLRDKYVTADNIDLDKLWMLDTPKEVRANSVADLCKAYSSTIENLKRGNINHFNMQYRKRKNIFQSIVIPHSSITKEGNSLFIYKRLLKNISLRFDKRDHINEYKFDCRLIHKKPNVWYLCVPFTKEKSLGIENQDAKIISLDPGVRTFLTGYSPNGETLKVADGCIGRITRLCIFMDRLKSAIDDKNVRCKKRLRMVKKLNKLRLKINNLIDELHHQTCYYLLYNYDTIILPKFNVSQMVTKKSRKISNKTVRKLLNLKHGKFRERLLEKNRMYNKKIIICNEAYTSKTCTNCGWENENLKSSKVFNCKECKLVVDRDINGARNILLRTLCVSNNI